MKTINVEVRKSDLVIRVSNWMRDKDEPGFDVEVYIGGAYSSKESKQFTLSSGLDKKQCREEAKRFAAEQVGKLL